VQAPNNKRELPAANQTILNILLTAESYKSVKMANNARHDNRYL